jgi:hypothetical protein
VNYVVAVVVEDVDVVVGVVVAEDVDLAEDVAVGWGSHSG